MHYVLVYNSPAMQVVQGKFPRVFKPVCRTTFMCAYLICCLYIKINDYSWVWDTLL